MDFADEARVFLGQNLQDWPQLEDASHDDEYGGLRYDRVMRIDDCDGGVRSRYRFRGQPGDPAFVLNAA